MDFWHSVYVPFHHRKWKNPKIFFSISGISVSKGGTLLKRVGFTAPSEARALIETQEGKVPPEDIRLSEKEQKSMGLFLHFWCRMGLSFVLHRVPLTFECSKLWPLQPLQPLKITFRFLKYSFRKKNLSKSHFFFHLDIGQISS